MPPFETCNISQITSRHPSAFRLKMSKDIRAGGREGVQTYFHKTTHPNFFFLFKLCLCKCHLINQFLVSAQTPCPRFFQFKVVNLDFLCWIAVNIISSFPYVIHRDLDYVDLYALSNHVRIILEQNWEPSLPRQGQLQISQYDPTFVAHCRTFYRAFLNMLQDNNLANIFFQVLCTIV